MEKSLKFSQDGNALTHALRGPFRLGSFRPDHCGADFGVRGAFEFLQDLAVSGIG